MSQLIPVPNPLPASARADYSGATSDAHLIALWLARFRSAGTRANYLRDATAVIAAVGAGLRELTVAHLHAWAEGRAESVVRRGLVALRSLLRFGLECGYLAFNVAGASRVPAQAARVSQRILTEEQVARMLALETDRRDHALLRTLYVCGLRVAEACALRWSDLVDRENGAGQVTVTGKGGKTRAVLVPASLWAELVALRGESAPDAPLFRSRKGGRLDESAAFRVVQSAAKRAGVAGNVSPHWLRHSHATHALARGAKLPTLQATLGHAHLSTTGVYLHARPDESSSMVLA